MLSVKHLEWLLLVILCTFIQVEIIFFRNKLTEMFNQVVPFLQVIRFLTKELFGQTFTLMLKEMHLLLV